MDIVESCRLVYSSQRIDEILKCCAVKQSCRKGDCEPLMKKFEGVVPCLRRNVREGATSVSRFLAVDP